MTETVHQFIFYLAATKTDLEHLNFHSILIKIGDDWELGDNIVVALLIMDCLVFAITFLRQHLENKSSPNQTNNIDG